jgi:hypothetical protein
MSAGKLDIIIEQGATFSRTIALQDSDGAAVDLSDVTEVRGQMRRDYNATDSTAFTLAVSSPASAGLISWTLSDETSAALDAVANNKWVYDIEIVRDDGTVQRLLQGRVTISQEVTR